MQALGSGSISTLLSLVLLLPEAACGDSLPVVAGSFCLETEETPLLTFFFLSQNTRLRNDACKGLLHVCT